MMVSLPDVTLLGVDCKNFDKLQYAAIRSLRHIKPGDIRLYTTMENTGSKWIPAFPVTSRTGYSRLMVRHLHKMFDTKFVLVIQWDGFVLNGAAWDNRYLDYDYIGAPWEKRGKFDSVGNGGFSLRSKRFCEAAAAVVPKGEEHCEDIKCCIKYRSKMVDAGVRFAPPEVAKRFSKEFGVWDGQFGFHGFLTDISRSKLYGN